MSSLILKNGQSKNRIANEKRKLRSFSIIFALLELKNRQNRHLQTSTNPVFFENGKVIITFR